MAKSRYAIRQRALTTGNALTSEQLSQLYETDVSESIRRQEAIQAREDELRREAEAQAASERAATVSGVTQALGTTAQAALLYKMYAGKEGAAAPPSTSPPTTVPYSSYIPGAPPAGMTPTQVGIPALAGYAGGKVGQSKEVTSAMPGGKTEKKYIGSIAGGVAAGAAVGAVPGAVIGGTVGALDVAAQETIICTELFKQGYLSKEDLKYEQRYGKIVGKNVHSGYLILATPVVKLMQRSSKFSTFVAYFGRAFTKEVVHTFKPKSTTGSKLGKVIIKLGIPLCKLVYKITGGK